MYLFDLFILSITLVFGFLGFKRGILRTILSILGLISGLMLGIYVTPIVQNLNNEKIVGFKPYIGLVIISICVSLGAFLFGVIGSFLRIVLLPFPFLKIIDSFIGLILAITAVMSLSFAISTIIQIIPNKNLNNLFSNSKVIKIYESYLPDVIKIKTQNLQNIILRTNFTDVFSILVKSNVNLESLKKDVNIPAEVIKATESIVKIDGISTSCSSAMTGTGFIVANEKVLTNAHVVAGIDEPVITFSNSDIQLQGKVVAIERDKDLALIYVPGLPGEKLIFMGPVTANEVAFVSGFPQGGPLISVPVTISTEFQSIGANIDGESQITRNVIVFGGEIFPGNSGGPLLNKSGQVLGVVFATDAQQNKTGYALSPDEILNFVSSNLNLINSIETGKCAKSAN